MGLRIAKRECIHFSLHNNEITRGEIAGADTNIRFRIFVRPSDICKSKNCNRPIRSFSCNSIWCGIGTVALRKDWNWVSGENVWAWNEETGWRTSRNNTISGCHQVLRSINWESQGSGKSSPVTGTEWPTGFQEIKVPRFRDNGTG